MKTFRFWKRMGGRSRVARVFAAYVTFVLLVAMVGPGLAIYAAEGDTVEGVTAEPVAPPADAAEPAGVTPDAEAPAPEAPAEEPVVTDAPAEPAPEAPAAVEAAAAPSVEAPVTVVAAAPLALAPAVNDNSWICDGGVKIDEMPSTKTYTASTPNTVETPTTPSDYSIQITVHDTAAGQTFDFVSNYPVDLVRVKGGTPYLDYTYDPAVSSDTGLHAPVNPQNGKYYDVSHVVFCFGEAPAEPGTLQVYKFQDDNLNGEFDDGEPMLEGWEFTLYDAQDNVVDSATTDGNGWLAFDGLDAGDYHVTEVPKTGWDNTTPLTQSATVVAGETSSLWFGNVPVESPPETGDLIIYKYCDANLNGQHDEGEPMLEGWHFDVTRAAELLSLSSEFVADGATDADGELLIEGLDPGDVCVTETLQAGWRNTTPLQQSATIVEGQTTEVWFGNVPETGCLRIHKYLDANRNGEYDDGEEMLEGWAFTVYRASLPPQLSITSATPVGSGTTDENGLLSIHDLRVGDVCVVETLQPGWENTTDLAQSVTILAGEIADVWFGNVPTNEEPETGDLEVHKFQDDNENGTADADEPMLEGWEFTLYNEANEALDTKETDGNGWLVFDGLEPGTYHVTETLQDGWDNTTPLTQTAVVTSDETAQLWFGNIERSLPFTELDLSITKVASKHDLAPGETFTYTLTYKNNGTIGASGYSIVDDYDERYLTIVDAAGGTVAGGKITWMPAGELAAGATGTITYTARVAADMPIGTTNIDNVVVISHPRDADSTNNRDDERVVVRVSGEPFLPFTGGELGLLVLAALGAGTAGLVLRVKPRRSS